MTCYSPTSNMLGDLDGLDLAKIAHRQRPNLQLIVTSGGRNMAAAAIPDHGVFIPKPDGTSQLTRLVEDKLAAVR